VGTTASNEVGFIDKDARVGSNATVTGVVNGNSTAVSKGLGGDKKTSSFGQSGATRSSDQPSGDKRRNPPP